MEDMIRDDRSKRLLNRMDRSYRLLMLALPRPFRHRFGQDLAEAFRDQCRFELESARGLRSLLRLAIRAYIDLLGTALHERIGFGRRGRSRASASKNRLRLAAITKEANMRFPLELRVALRGLFKRPGFSTAVILSLALGIGANSAVFSVVDGVLLNPFPYPDPQRLVVLGSVFPKSGDQERYAEALSPPEYLDVSEGVSSLERLTCYFVSNLNVVFKQEPRRVFGARMWGDPLKTFAMQPALGRGFSSEELQGRRPAAIISHRLWQSMFAGDPQVVGTVIQVNRGPVPIIGVLPARLYLYETDLWMPIESEASTQSRGSRGMGLMARLKSDASLLEANAELEVLSRRIESAYSAEHPEYGGWSLRAESWDKAYSKALGEQGFAVPNLPGISLILMGAVGFVLLVACANVANLMLARADSRRSELAVRAALGAGRRRIAALALSESLLLSAAGGLLGLALAASLLPALLSLAPTIPSGVEVGLDWRACLFTLAISLATALAVGSAPALRETRGDVYRGLKLSGRTATGSSGRLNNTLIAVEVAFSLTLLVGAGLLLQSLWRLASVEPGFDSRDLLAARVSLSRQAHDRQSAGAFFQTLEQRIGELPGVRVVGATSQYPPIHFRRVRFSSEFGGSQEEESFRMAYLTAASPGYFEAMGIDKLRGRSIEDADRADSPAVAVISRAAAQRYFSGRDPLGERIRFSPQEPPIRIVGVVEDVRNRGPGVAPEPEFYLPSTQVLQGWSQLFLIVRGEGDPTVLLPALREQVRKLDPSQPVHSIRRVEEVYASTIAPQQTAASLLGFFALAGVLLAAFGIYSVVSYSLSRRRSELGLRIALGATGRRILASCLAGALRPLLAGLALGAAASVGLSRVLTSLLFEVEAGDPLTLATVCALLLAIGLAASLGPARRASRIDPARTLRDQ